MKQLALLFTIFISAHLYGQNWVYKKEKDEMTGKIMHSAVLKSINLLHFGFPYGDSHAFITLRNRREETNIMFSVSKGQLHHNYGEEPYVSVKFDNDEPEKFACSEPTDGSFDTYFIENIDDFIIRLKKAKKVFIETEFFQYGSPIIKFNCANLVWEY